MGQHSVRRLLSLAGGEHRHRPKLSNRVVALVLNPFLGEAMRNARCHVALIEQSPLDLVIMRVLMLHDGPRTGNYRAEWSGITTAANISWAGAADVLLQETTGTIYLPRAITANISHVCRRCVVDAAWCVLRVSWVCPGCVHPVSGVGAVCGVTVSGAWPSVGKVGAACAASVA